MNRKSSSEKRQYPRIDRRLRFDIWGEGFAVTAESINLSCNGVLCRIKRYVPLMTHLRIMLALPGNETEDDQMASCDGVVVRVEEVLSEELLNNEFRIAVFFFDMVEKERQKIADYLSRQAQYPAEGCVKNDG